MDEFPATLHAFAAMFPDEASCWAWLRKRRWPSGFRCPRCAGRASYWLSERRLAQCVRCRHQASLTAGTVLHKTHVPLRTWLLAIFFLARHKQGISALQLQRDAGLGSYKTAWLLLHKLRAALGPDPSRLLRGRVEADESYLFAPHEKGRGGGRAAGRKTLVAAVVERSANAQLRLGVVRSHTFADDLGPFVRGAIESRRVAALHTDGLDAYRPLAAAAGVRHVRRVQGLDRSRGVRLLPRSHAVFSNLKSWLRGTFHGVSAKHLPRYLDEFVYRFNHRGCELALGALTTARALTHPPFPYARLVGERS